MPLDQVHFHEVGAVDSIVDIVAAAVCLDNLAPDEVIVTGLCEGSGFIRYQHGLIPVPVPAVLNIVQTHGLTLIPTGIKGELVTPTGAAIVAAIRTISCCACKLIVKMWFQISHVFYFPSLYFCTIHAPASPTGIPLFSAMSAALSYSG